MEDKLIQLINRVKVLYLSCNDKEFNAFIGHVIAGDIEIITRKNKLYNEYSEKRFRNDKALYR